MSYNFDNILLERGMYSAGSNLTDVLESIDPSENYYGTALDGLDAFSRQLKRFDIKVSGGQSDTVEKFFQSESTRVLFPEFVRRSVKAGMDDNDTLHNIVASTTYIDGYDYRSIAAKHNDGQSVNITTKEKLCKLHKRGKMLISSYESLRFQRLALFSTMLRKIGAHIKNVQLTDAIQTLINGDGNNNPALDIFATNDFCDTDFLDVSQYMPEFSVDTIIASYGMARKIMAMPEYTSQIHMNGDGVYYLPFNKKMIVSDAVEDHSIIYLDSSVALEMVVAGGLVLDYDKLMDKRFEKATISCTAGFSRIYEGAVSCVRYET